MNLKELLNKVYEVPVIPPELLLGGHLPLFRKKKKKQLK